MFFSLCWALSVNTYPDISSLNSRAASVSDHFYSSIGPTSSTYRELAPSLPSAASRSLIEATQRQLQNSIYLVADLIKVVKKPVIYAGHGVITSENRPELLKALADKASIPVTTILHVLGAFDELDEESLYMLGMYGSEADLIIALGAPFDDRITLNIAKFAPAAKAAAAEGRGGIVHFGIMPKNINKFVQATEVIEGDVTKNLTNILPHVNTTYGGSHGMVYKDQVLEREVADKRPGKIKPQVLIETLSNLSADRKAGNDPDGSRAAPDVDSTAFHMALFPNNVVVGSPRYRGIRSAFGYRCEVARPNSLVIDINGDASFNMTLTELSTAAQFDIGKCPKFRGLSKRVSVYLQTNLPKPHIWRQFASFKRNSYMYILFPRGDSTNGGKPSQHYRIPAYSP
ncbi:DHS-like NAD/FAD-binding domain-containing protein [Astrocystis sublimbata]|nr:DHS-like NAD/FAD-binding domain-containing protein [Astrocystis sublimbata]